MTIILKMLLEDPFIIQYSLFGIRYSYQMITLSAGSLHILFSLVTLNVL